MVLQKPHELVLIAETRIQMFADELDMLLANQVGRFRKYRCEPQKELAFRSKRSMCGRPRVVGAARKTFAPRIAPIRGSRQ